MKTFPLILLAAFCFQFSTFSQQPALVNPPAVAQSAPSGCGASTTVNLLAGWYLDDTSGSDYSGNGNIITFTGTPTVETGQITNALLFNGSSQYGSMSVTSAVDTYTCMVWINYNNASGGSLFSTLTPVIFGINSSGFMNAYNGSSTSGTQPISMNAWHMLAWVVSAGTGTFFVDGVADSQQFTGYTSSMTFFYFARDTFGDYFPGAADNPTIWSVALTQLQITAAYSKGVSHCPP